MLGDTKLYMKIVAKGVREYIQEKYISFSHFKSLLNTLKKGEAMQLHVRQTQMQSNNHNISNQSVRKVALSVCDTKRYLINAIVTLPFGHKDTKKSFKNIEEN